MASHHVDPPLEALLAHRTWVRALARRLADNAVDADDLQQDAWLAAVRARPHDGSGIRAWFAKVLRRRAAEQHRLAVRRDAREALVARPDHVSSGLQVVADAEALGRVLQAVLALKEPWRETVLLRFYEGLPPRVVAARMGVPVDTVRTRLRRAAELLREALGGRREDWLGAIAPLLVARHETPATAATVAGGIAMKATTAAAVLLAATAAVLWPLPRDGGDGDAPSQDERGVAASRSGGRDRSSTARPRASRAVNDSAATNAVESDGPRDAHAVGGPPDAGACRVVGCVLLPDGAPAVGAAVGGPGTGRWSTTGADGRFDLAARSVDGKERPVWVLLQGYRPACVGVFGDSSDEREAPTLTLVADRVVTVVGQVVSRAGLPIDTGHVDAVWMYSTGEWQMAAEMREPSMLAMLHVIEDDDPPGSVRALSESLRAQVRPGGRFEMRLPASLGAFPLSASVPGHSIGHAGPFHARDLEGRELRIEVTPNVALRGSVVDAATGAPIPVATVEVVTEEGERRSYPVDAGGRFDIAADEKPSRSYQVEAAGHFAASVTASGEGPATIRLEPLCRISGHVRLATGAGVAGAYVGVQRVPSRWGVAGDGAWTATRDDGSFEVTVGQGTFDVRVMPAQGHNLRIRESSVGGVAAGRTDVEIVTDEGFSIVGRVVDETQRPLARILVMARVGATWGGGETTGESGAFVVAGLPAGTAELTALDRNGAAGGYLEARLQVAAGTDGVEIVLRRGLDISGRIVDEDGRPVVGRTVIAREAAANPLASAGGKEGPTTDIDGRFRFVGLAPGLYRLHLDGAGGGWVRMWLTGGERVAAGSRDLSLTLTSGGTIAGVVVDASGTPLKGEYVHALWSPDDWPGRAAMPDEFGRFEIRGLPLGRTYCIRFGTTLVRDVALGTRDLRLEVRPADK